MLYSIEPLFFGVCNQLTVLQKAGGSARMVSIDSENVHCAQVRDCLFASLAAPSHRGKSGYSSAPRTVYCPSHGTESLNGATGAAGKLLIAERCVFRTRKDGCSRTHKWSDGEVAALESA